MPSENGRTFTADLERETSVLRRDYARAEETLAAAEAKIATTQERLEKFGPAMAEARFNGSPPPPAALDLQRQLKDAEEMADACRKLIPERLRKLREAEGKWVAQNSQRMRERFTQVFQAELAAANSWAEAHNATEVLRQDIATAAREFSLSLPGGPDITRMLQLLGDAFSDWTGGRKPHAAPLSNGKVAVRRLPPDRYKPLRAGHRLEQAVNAARNRLAPHNFEETFGVTPEDAKLLEMVHLVERVPKGGAA